MGGYPNYGILDELVRQLSYKPLSMILRDALFDEISKKSKVSKTQFTRKIYDFQKGGFVTIHGPQVKLTAKGRKRVDLDVVERLAWTTKKQDGFYRLIMFDIPEKRRRARDILREKLREFECYQIQKSVYATPYVCEDILEEVVNLLHIERFVHIVKVVHLGHNDNTIRKHFRT